MLDRFILTGIEWYNEGVGTITASLLPCMLSRLYIPVVSGYSGVRRLLALPSHRWTGGWRSLHTTSTCRALKRTLSRICSPQPWQLSRVWWWSECRLGRSGAVVLKWQSSLKIECKHGTRSIRWQRWKSIHREMRANTTHKCFGLNVVEWLVPWIRSGAKFLHGVWLVACFHYSVSGACKKRAARVFGIVSQG